MLHVLGRTCVCTALKCDCAASALATCIVCSAHVESLMRESKNEDEAKKQHRIFIRHTLTHTIIVLHGERFSPAPSEAVIIFK